MKVIESDKVVPLCRLLMFHIPTDVADSMCKEIQGVVDTQSFEIEPQEQCPEESKHTGDWTISADRAMEILDPEHREWYPSIDSVNEACRMGADALRAQQEAEKLITSMRNNKKAALWLKKYGRSGGEPEVGR